MQAAVHARAHAKGGEGKCKKGNYHVCPKSLRQAEKEKGEGGEGRGEGI